MNLKLFQLLFAICSCSFSLSTAIPENYTLQGMNYSSEHLPNENNITVNLTNYSVQDGNSSLVFTESQNFSATSDNFTELSRTAGYPATPHPKQQTENETKSESEPVTDDYNTPVEEEDLDDPLGETEPEEEDLVVIPNSLANLPHDIPADRSIVEVLAENAVKDKQYDELRLEELIHELMTHSMGFGEFYPDDVEYDDIQIPVSPIAKSPRKSGKKRQPRRNQKPLK